VERALNRRLIGLFDLIEHVADLVRPTALYRNGVEHARQGRDQAGASIYADHLEALAGEAAAVEIGEELLPFGRAFRARQAEVGDLLLAIGTQS